MPFKLNKNCLVCQTPISFNYINLGDQPLANSYHKGELLKTYPLSVSLCENCWHSQLTVSVDPSEMFEHYLYVSDTSKTLFSYFKWATKYILDSFVVKPKNALEIACNSGLFLEMFKNEGLSVVGVDPAKNIRSLSEQRGLDVHVDYWDMNFSNKLKSSNQTFDLILAFHVLPHVQDPNDFIKSCANVLNKNGKIFIQTSQCDMLLNNEFDVIYHEHSSYFTGKSIRELAHRNNLFVSTIIKTDIHSKSYLFSFQKQNCDEKQLNDLIDQEERDQLYTQQKYLQFSETAKIIKNDLIANLQRLKDSGYTLIGYGAAAKGNTLLNYIKFKLDYIIDDNEMKWGFLTPGMNIPITGIDLLTKNKFDKICFIPLAWNFFDEIKQRINKVRNTNNDLFVKYFPRYKEE